MISRLDNANRSNLINAFSSQVEVSGSIYMSGSYSNNLGAIYFGPPDTPNQTRRIIFNPATFKLEIQVLSALPNIWNNLGAF